jgi:hypothetical protein
VNVLVIANGPAYGSELPSTPCGSPPRSRSETKGADVGCCGTCMHALGIAEDQLVDGANRSTMEELADWTLAADRIVIF